MFRKFLVVVAAVFAVLLCILLYSSLGNHTNNDKMKTYCEKLNEIGKVNADDFLMKLKTTAQKEFQILSGCWVLGKTVFDSVDSEVELVVKTTGSFRNDLASKLQYLDENLLVREIVLMIDNNKMHYCIGEKYKVTNESTKLKSRLLYDYPAYLSLNLFEYSQKDDTLLLHSKIQEPGEGNETYTFFRDDGTILNYFNNLDEFEPVFYSLFRKYKREMSVGQKTKLSVSVEATCKFPVQ